MGQGAGSHAVNHAARRKLHSLTIPDIEYKRPGTALELASAHLSVDQVEVTELWHDRQAFKETPRAGTAETLLILVRSGRNEEQGAILILGQPA